LQGVGGVLQNLTVGLNSPAFILVVHGKYVSLSRKHLSQDAKKEVGPQMVLNYHVCPGPKGGSSGPVHLSPAVEHRP